MSKLEGKKEPFWLNKSQMAASLGISTQAFEKWGVQPVARIGREAFFDARSVVDNRLAQVERKHQPDPSDVGDIDPLIEFKLAQERLRLTAAQAEAQELKNEVTKARLIPVEFITFALSRTAAQIASLLDTIPLKVKRKHPELQPRHIESLTREIAETRNVAAQFGDELPDLIDDFVASTAEGGQ